MLSRLISFLKTAKKEFKMADPDDISHNKRTNNLQKYILDDTDVFKIESKCPANVKAAGFYNYLLNHSLK